MRPAPDFSDRRKARLTRSKTRVARIRQQIEKATFDYDNKEKLQERTARRVAGRVSSE